MAEKMVGELGFEPNFSTKNNALILLVFSVFSLFMSAP